MARSVQGEKYTWHLGDDPIGSGDAGEVYTAVCVQDPEMTGVIKKPARIATGGTIQRQAKQIAQESLALQRLDGLPRGKAHPPRLLDQAPEFTKGTANYFIVSETAPGKTLADLIAESRQTGQPFPRRIIVTVLDALFDLFSRAHKAGVLWNDVKLDHIYWHNSSGQIGVIDWGNALFLDRDDTGSRPAPPRWEDYQQMVDTLGGFLIQSAPDLYAELGWEEFQNQTLDSPRVSVLARRIAFQQQVVTLRVMEYQSLIRVILTTEPSLEGLQKIQDYQQALVIIGAPWESERVLDYARALIKEAIKKDDLQTAIRVTSIVWDLFDESLDLPWHLLRVYFNQLALLSHRELGYLVGATLEGQWQDALWTLIKMARQSQDLTWWETLIPIIRQQATGLIQKRPFLICQDLRNWMSAQNPNQVAQIEFLDQTLSHWHMKGEKLEESPFDYDILDLLRGDSQLPVNLRADLRKSFAVGEESIRELIKFWETENWEAVEQVLRRIAAWDPDRWGLVNLAEGVGRFKTWLQDLFEGPNPETSARQFLEDLLEQRPPIDRALGTPPWLTGLLPMLQVILQGAPVAQFLPQVNHWCPWLSLYQDIDTPLPETPSPDESALTAALTNFSQRLKNWSDLDAGLALIKQHSRGDYRFSQQLVHAFHEIFSLNANLDHIQYLINAHCHPMLTTSCQALGALNNWREAMLENDPVKAIESLNQTQFVGWIIIDQVRQETQQWQNALLPALKTLLEQPHPFEVEINAEELSSKELLGVFTHTQEIHRTWEHLYLVGLQSEELDRLGNLIDQVRLAFFQWRRSFENSEDPIATFLYHHNLDPIRQVSNLFIKLSQHIHQARLSLHALENAKKLATTIKFEAGDDLLEHMKAIEALLMPSAKDQHQFPAWQAAFQEIISAESPEIRQKMVLSLPDDHPLTTWLYQSTFDTTP